MKKRQNPAEELKVSNILCYIGSEESSLVLSLLKELSEHGSKRAMLIFPEEDAAYRVLAELCGLPKCDDIRIASLEIRINSHNGILATGCIEGLSALEYVPVCPRKENRPPLFFVASYGRA